MPRTKGSTKSSQKGREEHEDVKQPTKGTVAEKELEGAEADLSKDDESNCRGCMKGVLEEDSALQCKICDFWYHINCQKVSELEYAFMMDLKDTVHWYCEVCNRSVAKVIQMVTKIQLKQNQLETKVSEVQQDVVKMQQT